VTVVPLTTMSASAFSFSLGTDGFAFAFADLDACDSSRMIDQSTGKGIEYARVIKNIAPGQSIRKSFEESKKAEENFNAGKNSSGIE
jgi:hypothetical protein